MSLRFLICLLGATSGAVFAQGGGGFGGGGFSSGSHSSDSSFQGIQQPRSLSTEAALSVVTVSARAESTVKPEGIRVVIAFAEQNETVQECSQKMKARLDTVRSTWKQSRITDRQFTEDFVSVLPVYQWLEADKGREKKRTGYRLQTNLHLSVDNETEALDAIEKTFQSGHAEVVTFDYWSSKVDDSKEAVMKEALKAAKSKSSFLLAAFDVTPQLINVRESTTVRYPDTMYATYENILEEKLTGRSSVGQVEAFRPKYSFLRRMNTNADVSVARPMMNAEIKIVSDVQLYYRSPAEGNAVARGIQY